MTESSAETPEGLRRHKALALAVQVQSKFPSLEATAATVERAKAFDAFLAGLDTTAGEGEV